MTRASKNRRWLVRRDGTQGSSAQGCTSTCTARTVAVGRAIHRPSRHIPVPCGQKDACMDAQARYPAPRSVFGGAPHAAEPSRVSSGHVRSAASSSS